MSSFEAYLGWQPASPLNLHCRRSKTTIQSDIDLKASLASSLDDAKLAIRVAQARQSSHNEKRYKPPSYRVNDHVFLSRELFTTAASDVQQSQQIRGRRYCS